MSNRPDINPMLDELQRLITAWRDRGESLEDIRSALEGKAGYVEALIEDSEEDAEPEEGEAGDAAPR